MPQEGERVVSGDPAELAEKLTLFRRGLSPPEQQLLDAVLLEALGEDESEIQGYTMYPLSSPGLGEQARERIARFLAEAERERLLAVARPSPRPRVAVAWPVLLGGRNPFRPRESLVEPPAVT